MKPYRIKKKDSPRDCTTTGKYGSTALPNKCSCGAKHGKKSRDHKSRKARARKVKIEY